MSISRRRAVELLGLGSAAAGISACGAGGGEAHLRFKVTARAQLPGADYEGFAVNDMRARYTPNSLSRMMMGRTLKMESTVVDFGGKADALFVLLQDYLQIILRLWDIPGPGSADETTIPRLKAATGVRELLTKTPGKPVLDANYPKIAAFRDEADPASVYEVDPDNLAKTHGPGARFLGLSIEIVDPKTPLTEAIQERLTWIVPGSSDRLVQPFRTADDRNCSPRPSHAGSGIPSRVIRIASRAPRLRRLAVSMTERMFA